MKALLTALRLLVTGIGMGIVHVLTGADHLSALAALSANVDDPKKSFFLGAQWGVGHSLGLVFVAIILICLDNGHRDDSSDRKIVVSEDLEEHFEAFIGIVMILLGFYTICKAKHKNEVTTIGYYHEVTLPKNPGVNMKHNETGEVYNESELKQCHPLEVDEENIDSTSPSHSHHGHSHDDQRRFLNAIFPGKEGDEDSFRARLIALFVGIVHGVAGPGGVLGVIPAVHLHNSFLAFTYLLTFCITSMIVMGCFAVTYGRVTKRISDKGDLEYKVEIFSAALCVIVGITWLTLIHFGILDKIEIKGT